MKRYFKFNRYGKSGDVALLRKFVLEVEDKNHSEDKLGKLFRGKVVSRNKWSVLELEEYGTFTVDGFDEITKEKAILDFEQTSLKINIE